MSPYLLYYSSLAQERRSVKCVIAARQMMRAHVVHDTIPDSPVIHNVSKRWPTLSILRIEALTPRLCKELRLLA